MDKQINLNYVHSAEMGYGRLGCELADALTMADVEVFDFAPGPTANPLEREGRHEGLAGSVLWVSTPPQAHGWWSTQESSIFTMWEATRLPESFRENLHQFATIIVPSEQNAELFSRHHRNVRVVPLGIDPHSWHYVERTKPGMFFDFLIGGSGLRKGTDIAFEAFKAAFPAPVTRTPIPRLIMKNPRGEGFRYDDRILEIPAKIPAAAEQALYASAHCYLQPSRGEGFGLQPLQAIAQGMPTILTDAHGHESFAHLGYGIGYTMAKSAYFMYGDAGQWWEPSLDDLVDRMRWVYDHYDEACQFAKVSAAVVPTEFTWAHVAQGVMQHIDCDLPFIEGGEWIQPDRLKYRIRLKDTRTVDIAGRRMRLEAGEDYWELADVKRVLAEADCLTQDCIDEEDSGLADVQVARLKTKPHVIPEDPWDGVPSDPDMTRWHAGV